MGNKKGEMGGDEGCVWDYGSGGGSSVLHLEMH
jgi:hypothetical protein